MSIDVREFYYRTANVNGNKELDYLQHPRELPELSTVENHRVNATTENRLDLISFMFYGNYNMGWLIADHNQILDIIEGVKIGMVLKIPSLVEYYQYFNRNTRSRNDG